MSIFYDNPRARRAFSVALAGVFAALARGADSGAGSALTLAPVFGDHAVIQREKPVPVWGAALPGDAVDVAFRGESAHAVAGPDGRWMAWLSPLQASAEPADLVVSGSSRIVLHDVLVGDVWLCSGQSNMEFVVDDNGPTYRVENAAAELAAANYPAIRQLRVKNTVAQNPEYGVGTVGGWQAATPETVGHFTAVGYFFARDVQHALGIPIGIILSPWGGTPIESWMSAEARKASSLEGVIQERWTKEMAEWTPERIARYPQDRAAWERAEEQAKATHTKNPLPWPHPPATKDSPDTPGGLFNGMIAPLQPAAIRGFLWYQGEANAGHPSEYGALFKAMITSWREGFGQGSLPFYFVQLASFGDPAEAENRGWALLRDAQAGALSLPETGMAVSIDLGDPSNIHPRNKQEVGRRLALIAESRLFHVPEDYSGPVFARAEREGGAMRVRFTYAGDELVAHGGVPNSLEVAGPDRIFHRASGSIETNTLVVSSPEVRYPIAVRYAWTNAPSPNLYGDDGLPVVPFRSDAW